MGRDLRDTTEPNQTNNYLLLYKDKLSTTVLDIHSSRGNSNSRLGTSSAMGDTWPTNQWYSILLTWHLSPCHSWPRGQTL